MRWVRRNVVISMVVLAAFLGALALQAQAAEDWEPLGDRFATDVSASAYMYEGTVYAAYRNDGAIAVKKFDPVSELWGFLGQDGEKVSSSNGLAPFIYVHEGVPYVIYSDHVTSYRATAQMYNEATGAWEEVGSAGFSEGRTTDNSLAAAGDTLYAAYIGEYEDGDYGPQVKKFNEGTGVWQEVGDLSSFRGSEEALSDSDIVLQVEGDHLYLTYVHEISTANRTFKVLKFDLNTPDNGWIELTGGTGTLPVSKYNEFFSMVVYQDIPYVSYQRTDDQVVLMRYQDGDWHHVSDPIADIYRPKIIVQNGVLYMSYFVSDISFEDDEANHQLVVRKFDGEDWTQVGSAILPTNPGETLTNFELQFDHGDLYVMYSEFDEPTWKFYIKVQKIREDSQFLPSPPLSSGGPKAVGEEVVITFTDDEAWRDAIQNVKLGGVELVQGTDYTIHAGELVLLRPELLSPGNNTITIRADGYVLATVVQTVVPPSPADLQVKASGNRFIELEWTPGDGAEAHTIYYGTEPDVTESYVDTITLGADTTDFKVTKLTNDTTYYFAVSASADNVESKATSVVSVAPSYTAEGPTNKEWVSFGDRVDGIAPELFDDGTALYLAYREAGKAVVRTYVDGSGWETLGDNAISLLNAYDLSLFMANSIPFVAFGDQFHEDKLTVKKLEGSSWQAVGEEGFSAGTITDTSIAVHEGVPYVAYLEGTTPVIQSYDGTDWGNVGDLSLISGVEARSITLKNDEDMLYVAYMTVEKSVHLITWNETDGWEQVDTSAFPTAVLNEEISLFLEDESAYIAYGASGGVEVWRWETADAKWEQLDGLDVGYNYYPSVFVDQGFPYVLYTEGPQTPHHRMAIKKYINGAWHQVGNAILPESGDAGSYAVRVVGENPLVVYHNGHSEIEVKQFEYEWCSATFTYYNFNASTTIFPCGEPIPQPEDPSRTNYVFGGWRMADGELYDFQTGVESNTTTLRDLWKLHAPEVTVAGLEDGYVELAWDAVAEATGYEVYAGTESGVYTLGPHSVIGTSYKVEGLTNGDTYYFAVKAVNGETESDFSSEVDEIPVTKPQPPTIVELVPGDGQVKVGFEAPEDDGGSEIASYEVTVNPGGAKVTGTSSPITVTGLTNNQEYRFAVVAVNEADKRSEPSALSAPVMPFEGCAVWFNFKDDQSLVERMAKCGFPVEAPDLPERTGYTLDGWYKAEDGALFDLSDPILDDTELYAKWTVEPEQLSRGQWNVLKAGELKVNESAMTAEDSTLYTAEVDQNGRISVQRYTEASGWTYVGGRGFAETTDGIADIRLAVEDGVPYVLFKSSMMELSLMNYDADAGVWKPVGDQPVVTGLLEDISLHVNQGRPYVYAVYWDMFSAPLTKNAHVIRYDEATGMWQEVTDTLSDTAESSMMSMEGGQIYGLYTLGDAVNVKKWDATLGWEEVGDLSGITIRNSHQLDFAVVEGVPYLAYVSNDEWVQVLTYMDGVWNDLGSVEQVGSTDRVAVYAEQGTPYVLYSHDSGTGAKQITVKRFEGDSWEQVGATVAPAEGEADLLQLQFDEGSPYAIYKNGNDEQVVRSYRADACTVSFVSNGGTAVPGQTVDCGQLASEPTPEPMKANYEFAGWYASPALDTPWVFEQDEVTAHMSLYAKWNWKYEGTVLPIGLEATAADEKVTLSWDSVPNTVTYSVYGRTAAGAYGDMPSVTVTGATYGTEISGLDNGTTYFFNVHVTNIDGDQAVSEEVTATPVGFPDAPTDVRGVAGDGRATVHFIAPVDDGGSSILRYEVTAMPGAITVAGDRSPIVVSGLDNGTAYTFTVAAVNGVGSSPASAASDAVRPQAPLDEDDEEELEEESSDEEDVADNGTTIDVLVNGRAEKIGSATSTKTDGRVRIDVTVDPKELQRRLDQEADGAVVTIPVADQADVVSGELNGRMVKAMEQKQAVLEVRTGQAIYTVPARQINIDAVMAQLGQEIAPEEIKVQIEVSAPSAEEIEFLEGLAFEGDYAVVVPPLSFTIKGSYQGQTVEVSRFDSYVQRKLAIPDGIDPQRITTGVVVDPDGNVRHVPTKVEWIDGAYYATIGSLTNSLYSVIWNPIQFTDVTEHWAEEAVNDMGSRKIVNGVRQGLYEPDRAVTRAEFAAMLTRGLGLAPVGGDSPFTDMTPEGWKHEAAATAYEYGLVSGYEDGSFRPGERITREQAMVMIAGAMNIAELRSSLMLEADAPDLQAYTDASEASDWAIPAILDNLQAGIIRGRGEQVLAPKEHITRAEAAVIIRRLLQQADLI